MNGHTAYSAASPPAAIAHIRFGPIRSVSLAERDGEGERRDAGGGQAEADLGGAEARRPG